MLPSIVRSAAAAPCDAFEPNDNHRTVTSSGMTPGAPHFAKLCQGDVEDNYRITKTAAGSLRVQLTIPTVFRGKLQYFVYRAPNFGQNDFIRSCPNTGVLISGSALDDTCTGLPDGDYVVRIYAEPYGFFDPAAQYEIILTP
jgi:hypothetical protein